MIIKELFLKNIGPFRNVKIDFKTERNKDGRLPVTIITGENGTGKTIILDAIRSLLWGEWGKVERDIVANKDFHMKAILYYNNDEISLESTKKSNHRGFATNQNALNHHFGQDQNHHLTEDWVVTFWTSKLSTDSFNLKSLISPEPERYLWDALTGIQKNLEVTELICYFDYLKSSDDTVERELGQFLFDTLKSIIKKSIYNGELKNVSRKNLEPIIIQNGQEVTLDKLSSGNLFLIQRLVSLLGKMYSVSILNNKPINEILKTKGILLIDEAENHLHPKWQKTFIDSVQTFFPNMQIILTTHSPFIVASVSDPQIYICEPQIGYSELTDSTNDYSNKPIDEILLTPVFKTQPFSSEISELIQKRKEAILNNKIEEKNKIEKKLLELNPEYFSFIDIDNKLKELI